MKKRKQPLGEFDLIQRLTKQFTNKEQNIIVGIGDDCAVIAKDNETYTLATCDIQVAGVHFLPQYQNPEDIGRKAMAVNISDIAAMGGKPTYCLVSLILPPHIDDEFIESVYKGMSQLCKQYTMTLIGGNISSGQQLAIDIFLLGEVKKTDLVLRSGAKPGDKVLVTGNLGDAAAGLAVLQNPSIKLTKKEKVTVITRQCSPIPRLAESTILAASKKVTSMIDVSDGLSSDVLHICKRSNIGVILYEDRLPVSATAQKVARQLREDPLKLVLSGGEDYELLFTTQPKYVDSLMEEVQRQTGTQVTVIGEITSQKEGYLLLKTQREKIKLIASGWDHKKNQ